MVKVESKITWNPAIVNRLKAAAKVHSVEVGYPEGLTYPNGQPVIEVALTQEFGTPKIPPRPWIRPTIERRKGHWGQKIVNGTVHCFTEEKFRAMYEDLGKAICVNLQQAIDKVRIPKLSEYTIAKRQAKGNNSKKPLVDSGTMRDALSFRTTDGEWKQ